MLRFCNRSNHCPIRAWTNDFRSPSLIKRPFSQRLSISKISYANTVNEMVWLLNLNTIWKIVLCRKFFIVSVRLNNDYYMWDRGATGVGSPFEIRLKLNYATQRLTYYASVRKCLSAGKTFFYVKCFCFSSGKCWNGHGYNTFQFSLCSYTFSEEWRSSYSPSKCYLP